MAEDSAYWDGVVLGHAASTDIWSAPYSSAEFANILGTLLGSDSARGYVIPGYGDLLRVKANSPAAMNVVVETGRILIKGRIYGVTVDTTVTISTADAALPRLDRIVLVVDIDAQTITLDVVEGTPAATPSLPALTQNELIHQVSIGYVWVAAAVASIADTEVHDERVFAANFHAQLTSHGSENLLMNSEYFAWNGVAPSYWERSASASFTHLTKPVDQPRGRALKLTAGAASQYLRQNTPDLLADNISNPYVLRGLIRVTAGDVAQIVVTGLSATITKTIRRTGEWVDYLIHIPADNVNSITVTIYAVNNTDVVDIGQFMLLKGHIPGPYRAFHEILDVTWGDTAWNYTAKSTGATSLDITTDFGGYGLSGIKGLFMVLGGNDSGSAASATANMIIVSNGPTLWLAGETNDRKREIGAYINDTTFSVQVNASGASTFDAYLRIDGIMT